ncbi:hypothetical protein FIBSPDRAFT_1038907 [Athelia psychrophila]|uniref:Uncharacterized protein n=1 Tax=Athelia psychrophila TaxID=1759441 RepID=A0A166SAJ5_9AGAM|nr:hypothetical protein FIBSPDRAFT_1038907 [Fibularhizoctonia sp. CBS 109695]
MTTRRSRWITLVVPVMCLLLRAGASPAQAPFSKGSDQHAEAADNSNFIFAALHSNMKAWPSVYAPNGRAMVPATIKAGTLLYHSGGNPTGMDRFAFDAEHSYGHGAGGSQATSQNGRSNMLYTYVATRPLRAIYFDGFSAEKKSDGTLDMQGVLQYGIQGFVREEATFELLWCDFEDGVQMLSVTNITIPANPDSEDAPLDTHGDAFDDEPPRGDGPPGGPSGPGGPGCRGTPTPYITQSSWSWYLATAVHHTTPDGRVVLHPVYTVTLYDPKYASLAANTQRPRRQHRLGDLSLADKAEFRAELYGAMTAWIGDLRGEGSGVDWASIAHTLIDHSSAHFTELHALLTNVTTASNATDAVATVRLTAFALIMPHVDHAAARSAVLEDVSVQCGLAFTGHIDARVYRLTPQEQRLKGAAEGVSRRICAFAAGTFDESLNLLESLAGDADAAGARAQALHALERWRGGVEELMEWLGWAMWKRCPELCAWDVCYDRMRWARQVVLERGGAPPPAEDEQELKPRCAKRSEFSGSLLFSSLHLEAGGTTSWEIV